MHWTIKTAALALALAPVAGAVGALADTQENVNELAGTTGLDYNTFGGRIGANVLNFLRQTGNAATLGGAGALGRGVANVLGGESFFSPFKPTPAPAPIAAPAPSLTAPESVIAPTAAEPIAAPALASVVPFTREDIEGGRVPVPGTGAAVNTRTGNVINFDTREAAGPGAVAPTGRTASGLPDVGAFFGATARLRTIAQDNALKAARLKVELETAGKPAQAARDLAAATNEALRTRAAVQHLAANPGDFATAAAIAAGRSTAAGEFTSMPSLTGNDVITTSRRTGQATIQTPSRVATEAHVAADMTNRKMTRAQVIAAYEKQGIDTSRLKK